MARPVIPCCKETDLDIITVAITEPMETVMAKSKLDILEKLRLPLIRVKTTRAMYMPIAVSTIAQRPSVENLNHSFISLNFS